MKNNERNLVYYETISDIQEHPNADRLEIATVRGWTAIVQKGKHTVGEPIVYFEIDSVVPKTEQFDFVRKYNYRIRTQKLRGIVSQGLIMSLDELSEYLSDIPFEEGLDVADTIGVKKWNPKTPDCWKRSKIAGYLDTRVTKTFGTRVENLSDESLIDAVNQGLQVTEKVDGQSTTYLFENDTVNIMSHNTSRGIYDLETHTMKVGEKTYEGDELAELMESCPQLKYFNDNIEIFENYNKTLVDDSYYIIQGEIIGKNVRGHFENYYELDDLRFYVFNGSSSQPNMELENSGFEFVPGVHINIDYTINLDNVGMFVAGLHNISDSLKSQINPEKQAEGIMLTNNNYKIKVISREFLLK